MARTIYLVHLFVQDDGTTYGNVQFVSDESFVNLFHIDARILDEIRDERTSLEHLSGEPL